MKINIPCWLKDIFYIKQSFIRAQLLIFLKKKRKNSQQTVGFICTINRHELNGLWIGTKETMKLDHFHAFFFINDNYIFEIVNVYNKHFNRHTTNMKIIKFAVVIALNHRYDIISFSLALFRQFYHRSVFIDYEFNKTLIHSNFIWFFLYIVEIICGFQWDIEINGASIISINEYLLLKKLLWLFICSKQYSALFIHIGYCIVPFISSLKLCFIKCVYSIFVFYCVSFLISIFIFCSANETHSTSNMTIKP